MDEVKESLVESDRIMTEEPRRKRVMSKGFTARGK
jgi:hypothetical protein